jgi:assimilatory nitrate reductase catalytic subunit
VVTTIREDTIFIPYHWAEDKSANLLTIRALDPVSNIPEFKVCACRVGRGPLQPPLTVSKRYAVGNHGA